MFLSHVPSLWYISQSNSKDSHVSFRGLLDARGSGTPSSMGCGLMLAYTASAFAQHNFNRDGEMYTERETRLSFVSAL